GDEQGPRRNKSRSGPHPQRALWPANEALRATTSTSDRQDLGWESSVPASARPGGPRLDNRIPVEASSAPGRAWHHVRIPPSGIAGRPEEEDPSENPCRPKSSAHRPSLATTSMSATGFCATSPRRASTGPPTGSRNRRTTPPPSPM